MRAFSWLFLFVVTAFPVLSQARLPEAKERSLLYWRYLCRGEKQTEVLKNQMREFHCQGQSWSVRAPASSGVVVEVIEND